MRQRDAAARRWSAIALSPSLEHEPEYTKRSSSLNTAGSTSLIVMVSLPPPPPLPLPLLLLLLLLLLAAAATASVVSAHRPGSSIVSNTG